MRLNSLVCTIGLIGLLLTTAHVQAQVQRIALVIGNTDYLVDDLDLRNPVNDATAFAKKLSNVGFEVMLRANATRATMQTALTEFADQLGGNTVGLFYFSGHGMQGHDGQNYLLPTDLKNPWQEQATFELQTETLGLNTILQAMQAANNPLNIVILDACRDNPLAEGGLSSGYDSGQRSIKRGLANINLLGGGDDEVIPSGTLIAYATSPNKTAEDGVGRHSPYTEALLRYIDEPSLPIEGMFKKVRRHVKQATSNRQIPWETSSLEDSFYFSNQRRLPRIGGF